MTSKSKILGLIMVAVLAMSAVATSAAQAQFTTNAAPTTVTATSPLGNDVFVVDGSSVECVTHFEGTTSETSVNSLTVQVVVNSCKAFGFASATVNMNGCDYVFHSSGVFDIECPTSQSTSLVSGNCEIRVGTQTGLKTVGLANNGNHVALQTKISGITVNVTKDGFLCALNGTGHKSASYVQGEPVTVESVSGGTKISVD